MTSLSTLSLIAGTTVLDVAEWPRWSWVAAGGSGLVMAQYRTFRDMQQQRDEAVSQVGAADPPPSLTDQLTALQKRGAALVEDIRADRFASLVYDRRLQALREEADRLLTEASPDQLRLFHGLRFNEPPAEDYSDPRTQRRLQAWDAENLTSALREIETRLTARQGRGDLGPQTYRTARLKDMLLAAYDDVERMRFARASTDDFREWEADLAKLLAESVSADLAASVLNRSPERQLDLQFDPQNHTTGLDDEATTIALVVGQACWRLQSEMDASEVRQTFEPGDWHGRWS